MKSGKPGKLEKGQIWRTRVARIEILRIGKAFIHYTVTSHLGRRRVSAQVSSIEPLENYLHLNEARLMEHGFPSALN